MFVLRVHKIRNKQTKKCERATECYTEFNAQFMYLSVHNFSCGYFNMVNTMFVLNILECKILWLQCFFSLIRFTMVHVQCTWKKMAWKLGVCSPQSNRVALFGSNTIKSIVDRFSRTIWFKCVCVCVCCGLAHKRFIDEMRVKWHFILILFSPFSFSSQSSKFSRENKENFLKKRTVFQKCIVRNWHF